MPRLPWWHHAHWWEVEVEAGWETTRAISSVLINSIDPSGRVVASVTVAENPGSHLLGTPLNQPPHKDTNTIASALQTYHKPVIGLQYQDELGEAVQVHIGIQFTDWHGEVRLSRLVVKPYVMPDEIRALWRTSGPTICGGLPWFDPAYTPEGTADPLLADTGHKLLVAAGMDKMRFLVDWGGKPGDELITLECQREDYGFQAMDEMIEELDYYGAGVGVATVMGTAHWSHSKTTTAVPDHAEARGTIWSIYFPPDDWGDYERFVAALVTRYRNRISVWEVMNEPDAHVWGAPSARKCYQQYLMRFYTVAKKCDPDCTVLCGRVGPWLLPMLEEGMGNYMDGVTTHPYPGRNGTAGIVRERYEQLQKAMIATGVIKPIECTEVGLGAGYPWTGPGGYPNEHIKAKAITDLLGVVAETSSSLYWYEPIQANQLYGLLRYEGDRYRPMPGYYTFADLAGRLQLTNAPIQAEVDLSQTMASAGETMTVTLTARNTSADKQSVRFWPIGFVNALGIPTLADIRARDWHGVLTPGQEHHLTINVTPTAEAWGRYPIGLAVISEAGNSLALTDLAIATLAARARATASSCDKGAVTALNDLIDPIWSGDDDVPLMLWASQPQVRREWVQYDLERPATISGAEVYWVANPKPTHSFENVAYNTQTPPQSWRLLYRTNDQWQPIAGQPHYGTQTNTFNRVEFAPVLTSAIRLEVQLPAEKGAGIAEWRLLP
ncbi:MAG: hypothetical protein JXA42_08635 [Anaerolineales bacterium]|nr:hypothetical protein [Anaerolineales bacterium]